MSVRSTGLKRILKLVARRIVVRVGTVGRATASLNISHGLRILTYHRVAEDLADPFCVAPAAFASQMELLATTGAVVELGMALAGLVEGTGPSPQIAITFDDGTEDFATAVFPVLHEYRLPATLYVSPAKIGSRGYLTWNQLKDLQASPVRIGSHGLDHRSLGKLDSQEARKQIYESKHILEERLGVQIDSLAYPFGTLRDFNEAVKGFAVDAGYHSACTSLNGVNRERSDRFALRRTKIEQGDLPIYRRILSGGIDGWYVIDRYFSFVQSRYD